jgi:hypothetical protein
MKTAPKNFEDFMVKHHPMAQASKVNEVHANVPPKGTVRFLFTAAQNATPVQPKVWAAILQAKKHWDAHLSVIDVRYKNPTSKWSRSQENAEVWAPEVQPYRLNQRMDVNKNLVCVGGIKIVPTATKPLSGFESFTGGESTIVGHTRYQFKTVPVPGGAMAKIMTTTGACTEPNYGNNRAGAGGEFHHCFGVLLVELDKAGKFYMRHLNFTDDGVAYDASGVMVTPTGIKAGFAEALVLGDSHERFGDAGVHKATFGKGGIVETLKPNRLYWHDVCDGYGANPHHDGNPFNDTAKWLSGFDDVENEVESAVNYMARNTPDYATSYVVPDNHGDFLRRWIIKKDWRKEVPPIARQFYLRTALAMEESVRMGPGGMEMVSPWAHWVEHFMAKNWDGPKVVCLTGRGGEGSTCKGIVMDMHGHAGPNGSRGSIQNLKRIGRKSIIGHSHSPGADEGCMQTGTSSRLQLEYNGAGPSGWLHCHAAVYPNGKRQLIVMIDGKFKL